MPETTACALCQVERFIFDYADWLQVEHLVPHIFILNFKLNPHPTHARPELHFPTLSSVANINPYALFQVGCFSIICV